MPASKTLEIAANELEAAVEDLDIEGDAVVVQGVPGKSMTLAAIAKKDDTIASKVPIVLGIGPPPSRCRHRRSPPSWPASRSTRTPARSRCSTSWSSRTWAS